MFEACLRVLNSQRYSIYRKGAAYQSGDTVLGYEALHVADAVVERTGDPSTALIIDSSREVLIGDRLVAQSDSDISTDFIPRNPSSNVEGNIISVIDGVFRNWPIPGSGARCG